MVASSNPAIRLHTIFQRYVNAYRADLGLEAVWTLAMGGAGGTEVRQRLVDVIDLMSELRRQLVSVDRSTYVEMFDDVYPTLLRAVVLSPPTQNHQVGKHFLVSDTQLKVLATLGGILEDADMGLQRVDNDARETIRASINDALEAVRADIELPVKVRRAIIARLHDILWAIDHLDTGGPEAAVAAAERLGFLWTRNEKHRTPAFITAMHAAGAAWAAFLFSAESIQAIETFQQVFQLTK